MSPAAVQSQPGVRIHSVWVRGWKEYEEIPLILAASANQRYCILYFAIQGSNQKKLL